MNERDYSFLTLYNQESRNLETEGWFCNLDMTFYTFLVFLEKNITFLYKYLCS